MTLTSLARTLLPTSVAAKLYKFKKRVRAGTAYRSLARSRRTIDRFRELIFRAAPLCKTTTCQQQVIDHNLVRFAALRKGARLLLPASLRTKMYKIRTKFARSRITMRKMQGCGAYMRRFGSIRGILVYGKLSATDRGLINFSIPQANSPINLRPRTSDIQVFEEIFLQDEYRIPVAARPRLIIDGGANIGLASLYFAKQYPDARIIAVEPEGSNIEMLKINTAGYPTISVLEAGIWHDDHPLKIEDPLVSKCGFRLTQTEREEGFVPSLRVDDILNLTGSDSIGILKLDIEGSEKEILQHSQSWIGKLEILAVELHDRYRPGCSDALYAAIADENFTEYRHDRTVILVRNPAGFSENRFAS